MSSFDKKLTDHADRIAAVPDGIVDGKVVQGADAAVLLSSLLSSGDRVVVEGDNQKQARFLSRALLELDPAQVNGLHMMQSAVSLDEHLEVFRKGIADRLDFAYSGPQAVALAELAKAGTVKIGAIHTYPELYARYFTDLPPNVALVVAEKADRAGNLFTGCNAEDTPLICEATHAAKGIVIAQVAEIVDELPRVDIPGDQVEFVVVTGEREPIQALFTRDPAKITDNHILMAMMVIRGIYAGYGVQVLNHGIGYATAAVELLLPTYAGSLGLKDKICSHWILNPHPTLIPAIESGFVKSIYSFGSEPGMERYIADRTDVFYTCHDGVLRSNRPLSHMAGHYAIDAFVGATLQVDPDGNSSTALNGRIAGFGGAPNLGSDAPGRRHVSPSWKKAGEESAGDGSSLARGRKLVVQITPTVSEKKGIPVFVDQLDAVGMAEDGLFEMPPVMIYGEHVTHIVTERGIAYLLRCSGMDERRAAIRAVAGDTPVGRGEDAAETAELRKKGIVKCPEDLGISPDDVNRQLLAAQNLTDLADASGGLYSPPHM